VRADILAVVEALSTDHETYAVLLHSGALQGTLRARRASTCPQPCPCPSPCPWPPSNTLALYSPFQPLPYPVTRPGTLDLLERSALNPAEPTRQGTGGRSAQESERRTALQILANLIRHDVSLRALFEDHPALDGVMLPAASSAGVWRVHASSIAT
jgi:hypothetical protein